jgi:hypothetical protein
MSDFGIGHEDGPEAVLSKSVKSFPCGVKSFDLREYVFKGLSDIFCKRHNIIERNPFFSKLNGELVKRHSPVPNRHRPFLRRVPYRQIRYLEYTLIR